MTIPDAVFAACALVCVVSAGLVVTRRNPVYATLYLLPLFLAIAILFVLLDAPFLAAMQVLVYGGAIIVVFLFVIMLINLGPEDLPDEGGSWRWVGPAAGAIVLFVLLGWPIRQAMQDPDGQLGFADAQTVAARDTFGGIKAPFGSTRAMGGVLFERYVVPFELISVMIVVGIVGAVLLSKDRIGPEEAAEPEEEEAGSA